MRKSIVVTYENNGKNIKKQAEKGTDQDPRENLLGKKTDLFAQEEKDHYRNNNKYGTGLDLNVVHDCFRLSHIIFHYS